MICSTFRVALTCVLLIPMASAVLGDTAKPKPEREPGVRLQVFEVERPMGRGQRLAGEQSANLDRTIAQFNLKGDEDFLDEVAECYVARLTSQLEIEREGDYVLEVVSWAPADLWIDGNVVAQGVHTQHGIATSVHLAAGKHMVRVEFCVGGGEPHFAMRWTPPGAKKAAEIPTDVITAEAFYFRPTSPGFKLLENEAARPGLHRKVAGLYPSLDIETIHPPEVEVPVGGLATMRDGTLVVATFDARKLRAPHPQPEPDGELWLYHNPTGDPAKIERELIAEKLYEPAGVCVVGDAIYVSQRLEVTKFQRDETTGNWQPTTVASGWDCNDFHALSFGLVHEPGPEGHPGFLYMAKGTGLGLKQNPPQHGSVWRIDLSLPVGKNVEAITGGHRTPNGLGWGPEGTLWVTDNQGEYTPANEMNLVVDGKFYGFFQRAAEGAEPSPFQPGATREHNSAAVTEASVWLPQDEIANSPSEPVMIPAGWPFAGQMLVGDVKYGGVNRVSLQQVDGVWQGAAYRFTQGCEGGINRLAFGPDGALYVGGIGGDHASTWNWVDPTGKKTYQALQRLTPNGEVTFDIEHMSLRPQGVEVRFTQPVDNSWLAETGNYQLQQWTYEATPGYGGPKKHVEPVAVEKATPASDGRSVLLGLEGLKPNRVLHLVTNPRSVDDQPIWSAEAWYTVRRLPSGDDQEPQLPHVVFVTGDNEYGSEKSMELIAAILESTGDFRVTVLKSVDEQGRYDRHGHSIPGLRALRDADLAVFFMRFRALPTAQTEEIERYAKSGRPMIGLRTTTHAFKYESGPLVRLNDGFGDDWFGQKWIAHYGHGTTSTAKVESTATEHPILRGVDDEFDLQSWLYIMNTGKEHLPDDCEVLISGRAIRDQDGQPETFGEVQPLAWTRELATREGNAQRVFYTSLGHPRDFLHGSARKLLVNAIYWGLGREDAIPNTGAEVPMPEGYEPGDPK